MRKIHEVSGIPNMYNQPRTAKVFRNVEWDEYVVKYYIGGVHQKGADYHTSDKADAMATAERMVGK